eukprot:144261-Amphidinium_carterae.1
MGHTTSSARGVTMICAINVLSSAQPDAAMFADACVDPNSGRPTSGCLPKCDNMDMRARGWNSGMRTTHL